MKLNDFLSLQRISKSSFAERLGTTTATVSRISSGLVVPRRDLLERIHKQTDGLVTPNDLTGLYCVERCKAKMSGSFGHPTKKETAD